MLRNFILSNNCHGHIFRLPNLGHMVLGSARFYNTYWLILWPEAQSLYRYIKWTIFRCCEESWVMKLHVKEYSYLNFTFLFLVSIFTLFVVYYFPLSHAQVNITSSQTLTNTPGNSTDPKIALYNKNVYVVWSDDSTGNGDIYYKRSVDNGTTFGSMKNLSNTPGNSTDPRDRSIQQQCVCCLE